MHLGCVIDAYEVLYMHNSIVCHFNLLLHLGYVIDAYKVLYMHNSIVCHFNGEANNFKMGLFNDIHEGSAGC